MISEINNKKIFMDLITHHQFRISSSKAQGKND
jgi:hypothetical protein